MFCVKCCDKCNGDLHLEEDMYGKYYRCLQCGRLTEVVVREPGVRAQKARRTKKIAA